MGIATVISYSPRGSQLIVVLSREGVFWAWPRILLSREAIKLAIAEL